MFLCKTFNFCRIKKIKILQLSKRFETDVDIMYDNLKIKISICLILRLVTKIR